MAIDKNEIPSLLDDTQVDVNPYEIPDKIWSLIEPYFESKYRIELTEAFPTKQVTKPTIVVLIYKRTPGREGSKINGKGYNFAKFLKTTPDGYVHELYTQQQEIILEYSVYATSTAEVKRIAWDLERAILETVGILQKEIEGFQLHFEQQTMDSSMLWRQQDEFIKRTLRFKALLPVKYTKLVPELRFIEVTNTWGILSLDQQECTRTTSEVQYYLPLEEGQRVANIRNIYMKTSDTEWTTLQCLTDYVLRKDSNQNIYIEWKDDYGLTPSVGQVFRVDYDLSHLVRSSTIKPK